MVFSYASGRFDAILLLANIWQVIGMNSSREGRNFGAYNGTASEATIGANSMPGTADIEGAEPEQVKHRLSDRVSANTLDRQLSKKSGVTSVAANTVVEFPFGPFAR